MKVTELSLPPAAGITGGVGGSAAKSGAELTLDPAGCHVLLDFDGTITGKDVLDELIFAFARDDSWKEVEALWQAGKIGSKECLTREFACVRVDAPTLERFIDQIPIDPGFTSLIALLDADNIPVAILSDGVEMFIRRVLARAGVRSDFLVRSNRIEHDGEQLTLVCPHSDATCRSAAAHCKCTSAKRIVTPGRTRVYVGDGRSDLCPSRMCEVVFAKGALARYLDAEGLPYHPYETLHDVARALTQAFARHAEHTAGKAGAR